MNAGLDPGDCWRCDVPSLENLQDALGELWSALQNHSITLLERAAKYSS
jgi:hypothetical protein